MFPLLFLKSRNKFIVIFLYKQYFYCLNEIRKSFGQADHTLVTKFSSKEKIVGLIVYVGDIIFIGDDEVELARLKNNLIVEFEIKDLGSLRYFLGMEVVCSKRGIVVSQQNYILDLLEETGMSGCRPADTPIDPNGKLWEKGSVPVDIGRYQRLLGKLIYLSHNRTHCFFSECCTPIYTLSL